MLGLVRESGVARDGQRFNKFKCTLRRSSLPLFASNGFPVLSEIGHRLVALFVVLCLPAIVAILCGFDRVAVGSVVRHPDHVAACIVRQSRGHIAISARHWCAVLAEIGLNDLVALLIVLCFPAVVTPLVLDWFSVDAVKRLLDHLAA